MKTRTVIAAMALLVVSSTLGGCKKEVTQVVNQVFSASYNILTTDWVTDNSGLNYYKVDISVPEVDDLIVQNGAVLVYLSFDNGVTFDALPEEIGGYTYNALHSNQTVTIGYRAVDGNPASLPMGTVVAKIVILDGKPL